MEDLITWNDGCWVRKSDITLNVFSKSLQYGFGVIDGIRGFYGARGINLFRLRDHTERLISGGQTIGLRTPFSHLELEQVQLELVLKNSLRNCYVRPIIYSGSSDMTFELEEDDTHCSIGAWEFTENRKENDCLDAIELNISPHRRLTGTLSHVKSTSNYQASIVAYGKARRDGFDDALFLDERNNLSEASAANIFIYKKGKFMTPRLGSCLPGITRETIISLLSYLGDKCIEDELSANDLVGADFAFLTGTAAGIKSVKRIGDFHFSGARLHKLENIRLIYSDAQHGKLKSFEEWNAII